MRVQSLLFSIISVNPPTPRGLGNVEKPLALQPAFSVSAVDSCLASKVSDPGHPCVGAARTDAGVSTPRALVYTLQVVQRPSDQSAQGSTRDSTHGNRWMSWTVTDLLFSIHVSDLERSPCVHNGYKRLP